MGTQTIKKGLIRMTRFSVLGFAVAIFFSQIVISATEEVTKKNNFSPVEATNATWVFSGMVTSETGENYGYFFQLQRDKHHFHATAALMDESSKRVLFREDSEADIDNVLPYDWHVGRSFLRFNAINHSWIFGVKPKNNLGFNFKVDMLKQFETAPSFHHLRSDVLMVVSKTSELNGHILTGDSRAEQFVTADDAWFRQIWLTEEDDKPHDLSSVLCRFNDGSAFYSVNLQESDAQSGAIAGWYNAEGNRQTMSQFIQVSLANEGTWHIQSQAPRLDLALSDAMQQNSVIAGFVDGNKNSGFCMLNNSVTLRSVIPSAIQLHAFAKNKTAIIGRG